MKLYYHPRTAIEAEILVAAHIMQTRFLERLSGKTPLKKNSSGKKIGAESAVPILVYLYIVIMVHKYRQSAKRIRSNKNILFEVFPLTIGSGKTMPFEKRHAGCEEREKINRRRIYDTLRINFFEATKQTACIFSKENGNMTKKMSTTNLPGARGNAYPKADLDYSLDYEYDPSYAHRLVHAGNRYYRYDANGNITAEKDGQFTEENEFIFTYNYDPDSDVYGTDYGFGLDAPKEEEETDPQNIAVYRRNYTWNEKNLLTKSSDRAYTVHYRYGEDGQRALKYTEEGRSETLYFNNFYTIHIPVQDKNNPQGLRVHKHIFVGNSRLVTAMTHTDNNGDNAEQREKRYYYHSDHLGSAQFVTDWRGRQYEHIEYTPYGELWIEEVAAGLDKLPFRFTGKEMDEETGLYYYGARYLDPKYSRWLSGDPALSDYIPKAPIDDEAKKHNENLPGMGGVFNVVNLHLYHYAGNNPIKYIDPTGRDDLYYDVNGQYLNTVASETNDVYLRQGSDDNVTNTRISTREEFNKVTAAVFGESSGNAAESNAIADVIMNRATSTGRTISDIVENTGIYGYNENSRTTTDNGVASNTDTTLNTARAAAIHGYTGTDTSSGAYFWEGTTFLDPQSQNYNPTNWFVRMGWGTTVGTTSNVISYLVTTTIGRTTFMRNNPQYRRVDYP